MFPFDPPENIRKPKMGFQGDQKGALGRKGLNANHFHVLISKSLRHCKSNREKFSF